MADSKVIFEVVVEGKNIKVVQKQVQDLGKAIDQTSVAQQQNTVASKQHTTAINEGAKASAHFNRGQKGVAGATNNGTKAFSKQRDAITGSSGLVGAYATLAANMFAATALFNAFRGAAQVQQLSAGMTALGQTSGLAMKNISEGLVNATDGAISLEQAMRSTVQITSAGLDPSSVIRFGEAARNASISLGRNLGDTIDRLTRGVTKLEPELLDELGIFIRIDEVTSQYAATVGKTVTQLTSFEKRIAFQDAALTQLEEKFTAVGESVDVNPYDRLGAALSNLGTKSANFAANGLAPIINYLSQSPGALVGVLTLLGGSVLKQALQSFEGFKFAVEDQEKLISRLTKQLYNYENVIDPTTKAEKALFEQMEKGEITVDKVNAAIVGVNQSTKMHERYANGLRVQILQLKEAREQGTISDKEYANRLTALTTKLKHHEAVIAENKLSLKAYTQAQAQFTIQQGQTNYELAQGAIVQGEWSKALTLSRLGLKEQLAGLKSLMKNLTGVKSAYLTASIAAKIFTDTVKLAALAFMTALPIIGAVITAISLLWDGVKWLRDAFKTDEQKAFEKQLSSLEDTMQEIGTTFKSLNTSITSNSNYIGGVIGRYEALGNAVKQAKAELDKLELLPKADLDEVADQYDSLFEHSKDLQKAYEAVKKESGLIIVSDKERLELQKEALDNTIKATDQVRALKSAGEEVTKAFRDYRNAAKVRNEFTETANSLTALVATIKTAQTELEKMGDSGEEAANKVAEALLRAIPEKEILINIGISASTVAKVVKVRDEIVSIGKKLEDLRKERDNLGLIEGYTRGKQLTQQIKELEKALKDASAAGKGLAKSLEPEVAARAEMEKAREAARAIGQYQIDAQTQITAALKENADLGESSTRAIISSENERVDLEIKLKKILKTQYEDIVAQAEAKGEMATWTIEEITARQRLNLIDKEITALAEKRLTSAEATVEVLKNKNTLLEEEQKYLKAALDITKRQSDYARDSREAALSLTRALIELDAVKSGRSLNADEQITLAKAERENKIQAALDSYNLKVAEIDLEYDLIEVKFDLIEAELRAAQEAGRITGARFKEISSTLKAAKEQTNSTREQAKTAATDRLKTDVTLATVGEQTDTEKAQREEFERYTEYLNILADMYEANGSIRMGQIIQEGETLQTIYKEAGQSATAYTLKRAALERNLTQANKDYDLDKSIENLNKVAAAQAEIAKLEAAERAKQVSLVESISAVYEAAGNERVAQIVAEGALRLKIEEAIAKVKANGDAAALAELNNLYAQLQDLKTEMAKTAEEIATRTGGRQAGDFAALVGAGQKATAEGGEFADGSLKMSADRIAYLSDATKGLREGLEEIGGDGPLIASVVNGAFAVGEAWTRASEVLATSADTWQGKMQQGAAIASAVGATITAIGNIQSAASQKRIDALQSEIEAEKKRDGKSAQSKAKIAEMEKKLEKEKRKQFEQDKKMKMAAAVMNTASAIMQALGSMPPPISFVFAGIAAAMGAMQIAAIASTSYQGGSSAPTGPTGISIGERSNTVDLAKSQSAAGEIGYLRGESGMGGINEFRPAFTGVRHRAAGGATTGYVVGEQGPELFVPKTPGTVVPNNELDLTPTQNVNFTIQAVDAAGVEDLLMRQRGSIIRMIRDAANSYGTPFLEEVNVGVYTPQAQGASRA